MSFWVNQLFEAIARQEGDSTRHNPLNLRYAGQIGASRPTSWKPGQPEPIAIFETENHGIAAGYRQLWKDIARGLKLRELVYEWAPPNENNTVTYLQNIASWTSISPDQKLLDLVSNF